MRIKVDKANDALYFRLDESKIVDSEEVSPGVILDYDEHDRVVGVEFLNISSRAPSEALSSLEIQTALNVHRHKPISTKQNDVRPLLRHEHGKHPERPRPHRADARQGVGLW